MPDISQIKQRVITAGILIPIILLATWFLDTVVYALLLAVFTGLGGWEWAGISGYRRTAAKAAYALVLLILLTACFISINTMIPGVVTGLALGWWLCALVLVVLYQRGRGLAIGSTHLKAVFGVLALVPSWLSIVLLHAGRPDGKVYVLVLLVLVWLADAAAFFTGQAWGRTKLAAAVSPGKTWEGMGGAVLVCTLAGAVYGVATGLQVPDIIIFSIICLVTVSVSVVGDLIESLIKRLGDVKDSGHVFPGHGGVMDRIDSLTAAAPVFVAGLWLAGMIHS